MEYTAKEVLQFVAENDVKFIRLAFCDVLGTLKNIAIMANELPRAFQDGIGFDASAIRGFMNVEESDLLLFPDPSTAMILPWRPQQGRVLRFFCDIRHPDGRPFEGDGRNILRQAVDKAAGHGLTVKIGPECEFYLFQLDENGNPTTTPQDDGGYFDVAPRDQGENVRREICLALEEMGIQPESSHHEQGPGQNEIDFKYSDALDAADNLCTFKSVVKAIAQRNGLYASFMPKPIEHASGSGLHINLSLYQNGRNIFQLTQGKDGIAEQFTAGILAYAKDMTAILNPITNSYARLGSFEAPRYVTWSHQNRSQLVRIPAASGEQIRMELRSADPCTNPYYAFALLLEAGIAGIEQGLALPEATNKDLYALAEEEQGAYDQLPASLKEATGIAEQSDFLKRVFPKKTLSTLLELQKADVRACEEAINRFAFEMQRYFNRV